MSSVSLNISQCIFLSLFYKPFVWNTAFISRASTIKALDFFFFIYFVVISFLISNSFSTQQYLIKTKIETVNLLILNSF